MIKGIDIINSLKVISDTDFEHLVDLLLIQGAFPEIMEKHSFLESYGINYEKNRTRKSPGRNDAEFRLHGIAIEKSVDEDWKSKLKRDVAKKVNQKCSKFVFCTNQDTSNKMIKNGNKHIPAEDYCIGELKKCQECFIIGQSDLMLRLEIPEFFNIRRNILNVKGDFFCRPAKFLSSIQNSCKVIDQGKLEEYINELDKKIPFQPNSVIVVHSNDYSALLKSVGIWALRKIEDAVKIGVIKRDYCFVEWPQNNGDLFDIDNKEISDEIESIIIVWDAHNVDHLCSYKKFLKPNTSIILLTKTSLKDSEVMGKLNNHFETNISEVYIDSIDSIEATKEEITQHESVINNVLENEKVLMLKFESLIYFYSPVYLTREEIMKKISYMLNISMEKAVDLKNQLLKNDLAGVTGNIFWLKHSKVAKSNLDRFIGEGLFKIEDLI